MYPAELAVVIRPKEWAIVPKKPQLNDLELRCVQNHQVRVSRRASWKDFLTVQYGYTFRKVRIPAKETPDRLRATYVLINERGDKRALGAYNLRDRTDRGNKTYGPEHMALTSFASQELDEYGLAAGLLLLGHLGKPDDAYSGFFNGFAPSHGGFHFQYVREQLPIWKRRRGPTMALLDDRVQMSQLATWFFTAPYFAGKNPSDVAQAAWLNIKDELDFCDVLVNVSEGIYRCIPVRRRSRKPTAMCITSPDHFGNFGGMELSGVMVVSNQVMTQALKAQKKTGLGQRLRQAFHETCVSR